MTVGVPDYSMDSWGIKYVKKLEFNPRTGEAITGGKDRAARDSVSAGVAGLGKPAQAGAKPAKNSPAALAPKTPEGKKQIESTLNTKTPAHKKPSKNPTRDIDTGKQTKHPIGTKEFTTGGVGSKNTITSETSTGKGHAQAQQRGSHNITVNTGKQPKEQLVEVPHRAQQRGDGTVHAPVREKDPVDSNIGSKRRGLNPLQSSPTGGGKKFHPRGAGGKKVISSEISHGKEGSEDNKQVLPKTAADIVILKCKLLKMGLIKAGYSQGTGYGQGSSHHSFAGDNPSAQKNPAPKIEAKHTEDTKYWAIGGKYLGTGSKGRKLMNDDAKNTKTHGWGNVPPEKPPKE